LTAITCAIAEATRDVVVARNRRSRSTKQRSPTHSKTAALRDKVAAADARIDELQKKRTETFATFEQLGVENGERELTALARIDDRVGVVDGEAAALGLELDAARADLETSAEGNRQAVVLQGQLAETRGRWDATTAILARVEAGYADLERRRAEMTAKLRRLADVDTTVKTMGDELLEWQFLTKGLGRDGLPVLEIDAAGPTISAYTNELLTACFGARFSVELVTQREKADGKGHVDDFSIQVFDNAAGGDPRDIADLSGGEQVIVAEALMNAISIYVNTTSPIPVRTCWRDETTGALDPENAQRYLAMLRKVQELGGFHHVFFISHNPDAAAQADAQIRVANGTAAIVLPPFAGGGGGRLMADQRRKNVNWARRQQRRRDAPGDQRRCLRRAADGHPRRATAVEHPARLSQLRQPALGAAPGARQHAAAAAASPAAAQRPRARDRRQAGR
jgi:DNA repair exonuclease SbcCD ATPase subunit